VAVLPIYGVGLLAGSRLKRDKHNRR